MFTGRQSRILEILLNNVQGMTGAKLSEHLGVSSRTIRNEVGEINRIWKEGNLIKASKRKGYFIEEQFADSVREYLLSGGRKQREEDAAGRGWMILGMTLETGRTDVFAVEEELSLSTPAVYKEVTKFQKKMVAGYQYEILQMSADRLWIEGDERKIRQFLFKLVKDETQAGTNMHVFLLRALLYRAFDQDEYEWMVRVIKEYFDSRYIQVSDANLYMVASAVYITMIRNAQNHRVVTLQDAEEIDPEIQELFRYLDENSFELDDGDRQILWGLFHGFKITANPAVEESSGSLSVLVLEDFCSEVMEKYHFDFWQSKDFYDNILIHIEYMMRRMETGYEVKNPILNDIKRQYPYAYEISMLLVPIVYRYKNCYIQDDEISFIAIFVEHFLENVNHKLKTVIISSPRFSINTIMSNWIQSNFHNQLEVTAMIPRHSLEKYLKENQVDLIISMADSIIDPVIATFKIDGIPNHYTQKAMNALIHRIRMNYRFREIIRTYFKKEIIRIYRGKAEFDQVILELSRALKSEDCIHDVNEYVNDVLQREINYPTYMGDWFMIPHPLVTFAKKTAIGVAVLKTPIRMKNKEIQLIFLLAMEKKQNEQIGVLFQLFRHMAGENLSIRSLAAVETEEEFIDVLIRISSSTDIG